MFYYILIMLLGTYFLITVLTGIISICSILDEQNSIILLDIFKLIIMSILWPVFFGDIIVDIAQIEIYRRK